MNLLQSKLMKKIEATIQANKINLISDAITGVVGGFTVIEGNGRGSGKRQSERFLFSEYLKLSAKKQR